MNSISVGSLRIDTNPSRLSAIWRVQVSRDHLIAACVGFALGYGLLVGVGIYLIDFGIIVWIFLAVGSLFAILSFWSLVLAWIDQREESIEFSDAELKVNRCFPFHALELEEPSFSDLLSTMPFASRLVSIPTNSLSGFETVAADGCCRLSVNLLDGNQIEIARGDRLDIEELVLAFRRSFQNFRSQR